MTLHAARVFVSLMAAMLIGGCAAHWPPVDPMMQPESKAYKIPPKQLLAEVKKIVTAPPLSLKVEEEVDGTFLAGYQEFPGEWHVARRWKERTRYRVTIVPDWNDPTTAGRVEVREFTEQRAADGMKWEPAPDLQRPERAKELLAKIEAQIESTKPK